MNRVSPHQCGCDTASPPKTEKPVEPADDPPNLRGSRDSWGTPPAPPGSPCGARARGTPSRGPGVAGGAVVLCIRCPRKLGRPNGRGPSRSVERTDSRLRALRPRSPARVRIARGVNARRPDRSSMVLSPSSPCGEARLSGDARVTASRPPGPSRSASPRGDRSRTPVPRGPPGPRCGRVRINSRTDPGGSASGTARCARASGPPVPVMPQARSSKVATRSRLSVVPSLRIIWSIRSIFERGDAWGRLEAQAPRAT